MNTSLRESFLLLSLSLLFFSFFSSLYHYYQAVAAGVQSSPPLSYDLSPLSFLGRTPTPSFVDEIGPLSIIVLSSLPPPVVTAPPVPAQAGSAALPSPSVVITLAPAGNIVVVVFSAPAGFVGAVILPIWWFFQAFPPTQRHKLCLSVKEHGVASLSKDLCLLLV
ncbi:uncharacterized protein CIMG_12951 [Coccidioides immitis RS]|uniref:Transmembrane protein n=1 Tax=Coccidioides immitis (strain RS) TaxID=246410 RepID=J3K319_COCIM|nr:uncharacterized protein CIMG_12951 [Coccidioides immitis RS]EAS28535.3 hypothetical protein CIMG_12951 [Coccidioides immitis RS]